VAMNISMPFGQSIRMNLPWDLSLAKATKVSPAFVKPKNLI